MISFEVRTNIDRTLLKNIAKRVLWKAVNKIRNISLRIVPVDTGRLKGSIKIRPMSPGSLSYIIRDGVDYGIHVEYGTWKMRAQPFLRPAIDEVNAIHLMKFWEEEIA